ncbi:MAG: BREX system Lon protease-like protein BrxL, partial [Planctomycetota bacterium]
MCSSQSPRAGTSRSSTRSSAGAPRAASGEFSRGKESIRAEGGIVMVGNFDVDVEQQQRIGHLLSPLPKEMR